MRFSGFVVLFFGLHITHVTCYSSGLVNVACETMTPRHASNSPQTSEPPYTVSASNYSFSPGDHITVTLQANPNVFFKGFLLQARSVPGNNIVGYFNVTDSNAQTLSCSNTEASAVSHTSAINKSNISVLWTAPMASGDVNFRATFVQSGPMFWVGVESPLLTVVSSSSPPTNSTSALPSLSPTNHYATSSSSPSNISTSTLPSSTSTYYVTNSSSRSNITTFNFTSDAPTMSQTTLRVATSLPPTQISSSLCGTQKVCFSSPADCDPSKSINCFFMSSSPVNGGGYQLEISGPSDGYVSIGFSDDKMMGNDDIYICGMNSAGGVGIQHAYSEGRSRPLTLNLGDVQVNLASYSSGVMQCSFVSRNNISTQQPSQQTRSLNSSYYILMAYGASNNGQIQYHGTTGTFISDTKVDLSVASNVTTASFGVSPLVKAHGSLMLIAWMTTGSLGMIFARYMKVSAKQLVLGKAIWFQSHVVLMVLTVAATIASFVMAFVQANGWSNYANNHAIIGCIVMGLAFFQPIIAVFRPSPESSRRVIFNWFHVLNAFVMKVLAVANLFLGFQLINGTSGWMVKVMGGFLGWGALNVILFEINAFLARKEKKKTWNANEDSEGLVKYEFYLLPIYLCGNLAFLIALLVGIGQS
ncbi:putative ferric-chelate reductase 1 [Spea bombifrons]|uniref:putative ferric-chelate reductase 1 n=1 Tax=Spea bombifrons TaxID=233779 RepID=UPI00234A9D63|nr:putative ferric-chelate reductase 1 [Spea bombifrons]